MGINHVLNPFQLRFEWHSKYSKKSLSTEKNRFKAFGFQSKFEQIIRASRLTKAYFWLIYAAKF